MLFDTNPVVKGILTAVVKQDQNDLLQLAAQPGFRWNMDWSCPSNEKGCQPGLLIHLAARHGIVPWIVLATEQLNYQELYGKQGLPSIAWAISYDQKTAFLLMLALGYRISDTYAHTFAQIRGDATEHTQLMKYIDYFNGARQMILQQKASEAPYSKQDIAFVKHLLIAPIINWKNPVPTKVWLGELKAFQPKDPLLTLQMFFIEAYTLRLKLQDYRTHPDATVVPPNLDLWLKEAMENIDKSTKVGSPRAG